MNGTTWAACVSIIVGPCAETPPKAHALLMFSMASLIEVAPFKYRYKWDGTQQLKTSKFGSAL